MFAPTTVEIINKKLPNEDAVFPGAFPRELTSCSAVKTGWKSVCTISCARQRGSATASILRRQENTAENRIPGGAERYARIYNIDYNRYIFCGYLRGNLPPDTAITHSHGFKLATFNASNLVYRKEALLAPIPANAGKPLDPQEPQ